MKRIIPREITLRGEKRWRVIVPKDLRGDGQAFFFFDDLEKAQAKADTLTKDRDRVGAGFHGLAQQSQALLLEALRRADGDAGKVLHAVDSMLAANRAASPKLIETVVKEFLDSKKAAAIRHRSQKNFKSTLTRFQAAMKVAMISEVTPVMIEDWLRMNNWKAYSRKTYLGHVASLFRFAKGRGYIPTNPTEHITRPRTESAAPGIHTVEQVKSVLKWCLKHDKPLIGFIAPIYFGGFRPAESIQLRKEEIHANLIEVTPQKSKTRRRRFIEINPTLKAWLGVKRAKLGGKWKAMTLRRHMEKMKEALNFDFPHDVMRHSFCSYGLPKYGAQKIAEWAGHSETILFAHYRERVKPDDAERYWALRP